VYVRRRFGLGLQAAPHRDHRRVTVVSPGAHPMQALTGIPASDQPCALVVDQCEEAVLLCEGAERGDEDQSTESRSGIHRASVSE
jgi:hypothetical protein